MRKAIKLCLALAMACTMAVPAFAGDTELSWSGEVDFYYTNNNDGYLDGSGDAQSYANSKMWAEAGLYLDATNKGDVWTTTASIGFWDTGGAAANDGANLSMANDSFKINFGTGDLGDATKNPSYFSGTKMDAGDELSKGHGITFTLPDAGFGAFLSMTNSGTVQQTAYAVSYDMVAGAIDFSFEYEALSTAVDEKKGGKDGDDDGRVASDMGLGVAYDMAPLAIKFSYDSKSATKGGKTAAGDSHKSEDESDMMLGVDYKLDDMSGASFVYQSGAVVDNNATDPADATKLKAETTSSSNIGFGYHTMINTISVNVWYQMVSSKSDAAGAKAVSSTQLGVLLVSAF
jgi:hypothetical protein